MIAAVNHALTRARVMRDHLAPVQHFIPFGGKQKIAFRLSNPRDFQ